MNSALAFAFQMKSAFTEVVVNAVLFSTAFFWQSLIHLQTEK